MQILPISEKRLAAFLTPLANLYREMDAAYEAVARLPGFRCEGCLDNCCLTRFYHHTYIEYYDLMTGFGELPLALRSDCLASAREVCQKTEAVDLEGGIPRLMCPLNVAGKCLLYKRRPMICRLHGVHHDLIRPDGRRIHGVGCEAFMALLGDNTSFHRLDRTPFYVAMMTLEQKFRQAFGLTTKFKYTVAEMIRLQEEL